MKGPATPSSPAHRRVEIDTLRDADHLQRGDAIAVEEPLEIRLLRDRGRAGDADGEAGRPVSIMMRTPGNDAELALGFLYGEGILREPRDVIDARSCGPKGNVLQVTVRADLPLDIKRLERNFYTTSSCGVCGKASIDAVTASLGLRTVTSNVRVTESVLRSLPEALREARSDFAPPAGMHAVGLFDVDGELLASYEDVGRHNAMDKLVGASLIGGQLPWTDRIVLFSGRASFELIQKAMMANVPIVAAIGPPSTLALELAHSAGITLIALLSNETCDVYCHPERVRPGLRQRDQ